MDHIIYSFVNLLRQTAILNESSYTNFETHYSYKHENEILLGRFERFFHKSGDYKAMQMLTILSKQNVLLSTKWVQHSSR